jgi:hypothetical protein
MYILIKIDVEGDEFLVLCGLFDVDISDPLFFDTSSSDDFSNNCTIHTLHFTVKQIVIGKTSQHILYYFFFKR